MEKAERTLFNFAIIPDTAMEYRCRKWTWRRRFSGYYQNNVYKHHNGMINELEVPSFAIRFA